MGGRSNSSSDTTYEDRRVSSTIGIETGGGDAIVGDGNTVRNTTITARDGSIVGDGNTITNIGMDADVALGAIEGAAWMADSALISAENMNRDNAQLASDLGLGAFDLSRDGFDLSRDVVRENSDLAFGLGGMMGDTANNAMFAMGDTTSAAMMEMGGTASDAMLAMNDTANSAMFGMENLAGNALRENSILAGQFGDNLTSISNTAMRENSILAGQSVDAMGRTVSDSLMFADNQNYYLAEALGSNANRTQDTLLSMSEMQERSLDNALGVAHSVAMNDNAETQIETAKYMAFAMVGVGALLIFGGKR